MEPSRPRLVPPANDHRGVLVWDWPEPGRALSSASVGGGWARPRWAINLGVPLDYARTDLAAHAAEVVLRLGLDGPGVALFTAADVSRRRRGDAGGVTVDATVGITKPTWAADPDGGWSDWNPWHGPIEPDHPAPHPAGGGSPPRPGTINLVAQLPVGLEAGAFVNAVMTMTEAKTQALIEAGVPGTGTASDAVLVVCPEPGRRERFTGPRSPWGARLAQATHTAVTAGL
ncbi:MAG: adenosylcobinamide amidohydrolase [Acidimicrobiales bacterium]